VHGHVRRPSNRNPRSNIEHRATKNKKESEHKTQDSFKRASESIPIKSSRTSASTSTSTMPSNPKDEPNTFRPGGIVPIEPLHQDSPEAMKWLTSSTLAIVVLGASGDLAKKKTYTALLNLYDDNLLPKNTVIWGYARSKMTDEDLRNQLRPYLSKTDHSSEIVERFLSRCVYQGGSSYGDLDAFTELAGSISHFEKNHPGQNHSNRLFYFAIPPNVFADTAVAIKKTSMQDEKKGWTRLIVEKPFGRDLESFEELNKTLSEHFTEDHLYRIDHYLGKEMVQNLTVLRFSNIWFERVWNKENIKTVILTFKEPFGTEGRGGYFDKVRLAYQQLSASRFLSHFSLVSHFVRCLRTVRNHSRYSPESSVAGPHAFGYGGTYDVGRPSFWKGYS
jgi:hypothetical protein